jgi:hypothetical protein
MLVEIQHPAIKIQKDRNRLFYRIFDVVFVPVDNDSCL